MVQRFFFTKNTLRGQLDQVLRLATSAAKVSLLSSVVLFFVSGCRAVQLSPVVRLAHLPEGKTILSVSTKAKNSSHRAEGALDGLRFGDVDSSWTAVSIGMKFIRIESGSFIMGESGGVLDEGPAGVVEISRPFLLGKFEVTQAEYQAIVGENPSRFKGERLPVDSVSWHDARRFCELLTEKERQLGRLPLGYVYRLPTEAEWEGACRAGTRTAFAFGESLSSHEANFAGGFSGGKGEKGPLLEKTVKVGSYVANDWGLYDMHGNVWEWCLDGFHEKAYSILGSDDPYMREGLFRVLRGGSWGYKGRFCRSAVRNRFLPDYCHAITGLRVALAPEN